MEAELADGTILEFPDGTDPSVIQATVKKMIAGAGSQPSSAAEIPMAAAAPQRVVASPVAAPQKSVYRPYVFANVFDNVTGAITEPLMKMGSSLIAKPVSEVMGISAMFADYLGNKQGDPRGFQKSVQESLTYEPRTAAGASKFNPLNAIPDLIGQGLNAVTAPVMDTLRGDSSAESVRGAAVNALGEAVPQALGMVGVKNAPVLSRGLRNVATDTVADASKSMAFSKQAAKEAASTADWQRAPIIEAAKIGRTNNLTMNPAVVNPSMGATVSNAMVNSDYFNAAASINNAPKFNQMVRKELGIPKDTVLDAKAYSDAAFRISKPYRDAEKIGKIVPDAAMLGEIKAIEIPKLMGTSAADAGKIKRLTDTVAQSLEDGISSSELMKTTASLRKEAGAVDKAIRKGDHLDPTTIAEAKAKRQIADILDRQLASNVTPALAKELADARVKLAQLNQHKKATNFGTGQVDPTYYANAMKDKNLLTGAANEMGQFAANMPEVADVFAKKVGAKIHLPARSGVAGTAGYAAGTLTGTPVAASAISAGMASLGGKVKLKSMLSDEYQAKNLVPKDRRLLLQTNGMMQP